MTQRVLRAMDDPHLTILGHPTGRLLLSRDPFRIDVHAAIAHAAERGLAPAPAGDAFAVIRRRPRLADLVRRRAAPRHARAAGADAARAHPDRPCGSSAGTRSVAVPRPARSSRWVAVRSTGRITPAALTRVAAMIVGGSITAVSSAAEPASHSTQRARNAAQNRTTNAPPRRAGCVARCASTA